jgi:tagaturonate reductase
MNDKSKRRINFMERLNRNIYKGYTQYTEKVLQFGEGNFLRGFVDWMLDKMNKEAGFNGSAVIVQPREGGLVEVLNQQDCLYTLYLNGIKNGTAVKEHTIINSVSRGVNPFTNFDDYLKIGENPDLRFMISNTTEAGIAFDPEDKLEDRPQKSFPGKVTALLYRRYKFFNGEASKGLIIIPCELIDRNGEKLKAIIEKYAELWNLEEGFTAWLNNSNTFCCSLVDRIVPGYPKETIKEILEELGYDDKMIVEGEQFHLWVIEGPKWIQKEFPTDKAGLNVLFVDDMTPYRARKVKLLNGPHTAMVPVGYLYGLDTVRETVEDEVLGKFVKELMFEEIAPTVDLPAEESKKFAEEVLDRFKNPFVKHYLSSIALNSMSKYETRDLPCLLGYAKLKGQLPKKLVFSLAALIEFYKGERNGEKFALADSADVLELFSNLWSAYDKTEEGLKKIVTAVLAYEKNWKMNLNEMEGLTDAVASYLSEIENKGMKEAVKAVL